MTTSPEPPFGIVRVAPFAGFVHRFEDLIGSATTMALYFIHSRRWRENHDAAIKAFVGRANTTLEVFLPDLESHELMFSLGKHFEDGLLIRFPVAANTALARAGPVTEVPGSPIPPGASRFRTRWTSIVGASFIRRTL